MFCSLHLVFCPPYPGSYVNVFVFPDLNFDDCAFIPRVLEGVVHAPILVGSLDHEPPNVVPEPPLLVPESYPEIVPDVAQGLDDVHQSLGSMGVRDDADESDDDIQVLFPNTLSALSEHRLHSCLDFLERTVHVEPTVMSTVSLACSNQVCEASISGEENIGRIGPVPSDSSSRWLNVVIDLNGIVCACVPTWKGKGFRNTNFHVHSATLPTEVGKKLVWVRPSCSDFLSRLSSFATITVWSSMMKATAEEICDFLFGPIQPIRPIRILGQEDCDRVPLRKEGYRTLYMKEHGTQKDIFLKTLAKHLFDCYDGFYTADNTLIIDDSPIKHMLNSKENVLLLPSWSYGDVGAGNDSVLTDKLLPYLLDLHRHPGGLAEYRSCHLDLGRPMFYDDRQTCSEYVKIMKAISDWEARSLHRTRL